MSDKMQVLPFGVLLDWILDELDANQSIFGIHRSLFYVPRRDSLYSIDNLYGHYLATPIGPAAGPHTQLAQNILCAWLSGGRFIELKTVQIMDELEIPRPCIDMADEGYNVEWSQELKLDQSASEYAKAWVLIHILRRLLGHEGNVPLGTVFNMSVGYDLEGIRSPAMTRLMDRLADASEEIAEIQDTVRKTHPELADVEIPSRITDNVTLSTMHGCPPAEIERIARYLLEQRGLHTIVKLNPTLLGRETAMRILHDKLGYREIRIPDVVFEHDLQYDRAVELIKTLKQVAEQRGMVFGVKLSNTLAMANHRGCMPGDRVYMSGRALYPVTMHLFHKLAREFAGELNVSYSAGADALNLTTVLSTGARPVTVASDLLKPGGYSRLLQYLENLGSEMQVRGVQDLDGLAEDALGNLAGAAADAVRDPRYSKGYHPYGLPKVQSGLGLFDCVTAPCEEQCAVHQDVPEYAWWIARGECDRALEAILARNPLPAVTGYICTHLCQTRCTRNNYDEPVAIRALKRFAARRGQVKVSALRSTGHSVAIVGSGPSGLAAAYFLALNGVRVTIYEAKDVAGGMLALAPRFRLPAEVVRKDIDRIIGMGVHIELCHPVTEPPEQLLERGFDAVYVACGFPNEGRLGIVGADGEGVIAALDLLERVARGEKPDLGAKVAVIGGGNTAMDAARTAQRLTGRPATVVYRRSKAEMPAEKEEVEGLLAEGNLLVELVSPIRVILREGQVVGLECLRNRLGEPGVDGRRRPVPIEGSAFQIEADSIIAAIGQQPDIAFLEGSAVSFRRNGVIAVDPDTGMAGVRGVYAGGDAVRGPAIVVEACADGRRAAEAICARFGIHFESMHVPPVVLSDDQLLQVKHARARSEAQYRAAILPVAQRSGFDLIEETLTEEVARREAERCLQCSSLCDKCVEVCPNRANYVYRVTPMSVVLPRLECQSGELVVVGQETCQVRQARQIVHVDDLCNECGNCATFCVHQGKPYLEKPRLFLREEDYELENDNAFHIQAHTIRRRDGGRESRLSVAGGALLYQDELLDVSLSPALEIGDMQLKKTFEEALSLRKAAEMAVMLRGLTASLPFLLRALSSIRTADDSVSADDGANPVNRTRGE